MKILLLGDHPANNWEGSSTIFLQQELTNALGADGEDVSLFIPFRRRELHHFLFGTVKKIKRDGYIELNGGILPMIFHSFRQRPDVVHCILIRTYMLWLVAVYRMIGTPILSTMHDTLFLQKKSVTLLDRVKRYIVRSSSRVLVLSQKDNNVVEQWAPDIVRGLVRHGIRIAEGTVHPEATGTILFGGGLDSQHKGLMFLEDALRQVDGDHSLAVCGPNFSRTHHPGYRGMLLREDFNQLLRQCRMVIVPSEYEPFSMTALEALAAGTPLIITESCGICRYLNNGVDSLHVRYGDVTQLAELIHRLATDDQLWTKLRKNGLFTASKFSWDTVSEEYSELYRDVLRRKGTDGHR